MSLRVAILCFGTTGRGGMETVIAATLRQFELDGDVPRLFLLGGSADLSWIHGLPVTVLGSASDAKLSRYSQYVLKLPWMLRSFAPDVVLCADTRTVLVAAAIKKMLRMRTKVVSWLHFAVDRLSHTKNLRLADAHFAISTGVAKDLRARGLDAVSVVYNPVVRPLKMHPRSETTVFIHLGRITLGGQKRTDDFLRALTGLRGQYRAAVVGGGPDEGRLKNLAEELGVSDKIDWLGWQARPWDVAPPASALVMTSEYEGFAMVLAEAIARGLPVISTDCHAGPADVVNSSTNGWLVPVGGVAQLTELMQRIIDEPAVLPSQSRVASTATRFEPASVTSAMRMAITGSQP
jgi:UDP-D-galactose:(glucosyl)LPS alpha-1,6-D-galactosyltransferase